MRRKIIPYYPRLKELAKKVKEKYDPGRNPSATGVKRKAIDEYIVDFYCKELMLAIEIDGE